MIVLWTIEKIYLFLKERKPVRGDNDLVNIVTGVLYSIQAEARELCGSLQTSDVRQLHPQSYDRQRHKEVQVF